MLLALSLMNLAAAGPDFRAGPIYECTEGSSHTAWVQVHNDGDAATPGTYVDVFVGWATDESDPSPPLGMWGDHYAYTSGLAVGESRWVTVPLSGSASWIDAVLDTDAFVAEDDEGNNTDRAWGDFATCTLQDLDLEDIATPRSACPGQDIGAWTELTLHNPAPEDVTSNSFVSWYLSDDPVLDWGDDLLVGGRDTAGPVASGASLDVEADVNVIPAGASYGEQYLLTVIDEYDRVAEADETDNVIARPIDIRPCATGVVDVGTQSGYTCAVLDNGDVRCWGYSAKPLGYDSGENTGDDELPSELPPLDLRGARAVQVETQYTSACVLLDTGAVRCWGAQLREDGGFDHLTAAQAMDLDLGGPASAITVGIGHSCALMDTGAVRCWGNNYDGQLGHGNTDDIGYDAAIGAEGDVPLGGLAVDVDAGQGFTCAVLLDGGVRCWGGSELGQTGYAQVENIGDDETPASVGDIDLGGDAVAVDAGYRHACAVMADLSVRCWGFSDRGELGLGYDIVLGDDEHPSSVGPVQMGPNTARDAAVDGRTTCVSGINGELHCWSVGEYGRSGYATTEDIGDDEHPYTFGPVSTGGFVVDVDTSQWNTCAVFDDGGLRCWGNNQYGQLGYGNTTHIGDDEVPSSVGTVSVIP